VTSSVDLLNIYVLALELRGRSDGLNYASAVRAGTMAGARLHQQLDLRSQIQDHGGNVDVFGAIHSIDLPLLLRPLQGLLGAYINDPGPGVLVTTQRPMSIQRFTAAHELGHFSLGHQPSLDDDSILRRMAPRNYATFREFPGSGGRRLCDGIHDAQMVDRVACQSAGVDDAAICATRNRLSIGIEDWHREYALLPQGATLLRTAPRIASRALLPL